MLPTSSGREQILSTIVFLCFLSQISSLPVREQNSFYNDILRQLRGTNFVHQRTHTDTKTILNGRVRRGSPEYFNMVRDKLENMASSALDLKYRLQETFTDYCIRRKRAIPADKFKNCEMFAVAMTSHPLLEIPELVSHNTPALQNVHDVLKQMLKRALNTIGKFKKVIMNVTEMEEMEICKENLLNEKSCHIDCSKNTSVHKFWCQMESITKRLNSLIEHIKSTMNELELDIVEFGLISAVLEPRTMANSHRLAYNFAALHRLIEQTSEFYEKVVELQNRIP